MNLGKYEVDTSAVMVLSDDGAEEIVVKLPTQMWRRLLMAAAHFYELQATSTIDVLCRMYPKPSEQEMVAIRSSYERDAGSVLDLLLPGVKVN